MRPTREMRLMEHVPRWSIVRLLKQQTVAEHSFMTAMIADWIANAFFHLNPQGRLFVLQHALRHDLEETFTGDIPGPVKRRIVDVHEHDEFVIDGMRHRFSIEVDPYLEDLASYTQGNGENIVRLASSVEETCFLAQELQMGNFSVNKVYESCRKRMLALCDATGKPLREDMENLVLDVRTGQDVCL